ncbi:hypothetical protein [Trinickia sp.]|uniref:hypothetical protein n=1 Tax=Trinickia sp. TaxID=2571163 RepID=UPI003F810CCD
MNKETNFYKLEYNVGQNGAEYFVGARWNVDEFEWDPLDPSTYTRDVRQHYECAIQGDKFEVDCWLYNPHICGSKKLIEVLDVVGARYRAIPFDLLGGGKKKKKIDGEHYIILIKEGVSMMDASRSEYEVMVDLETGRPVPEAPSTNHPRYEKIDRFIFRDDIKPPPLYTCTETGWIMVSEEFMRVSEEAHLSGPTFVRLFNGIKYDAFDGI